MNPDHALLLDFVRRGAREPTVFGSNPLACALGTTLLAADAERGIVRLGFEPDARFVQGNGAVQGGIVAAMLDFATAFAVLLQLPLERSAVTATLDLQLLRAATAGRFIAQGNVRRLGRTFAFASAELLGEGDDRLIAVASAALPLVNARSD